jgi:uncharacterized protein
MLPAIKIIVLVALSWFVAQSSKVVVESIRAKKFLPDRFVSFGGMPSSHAAFVAALCTSLYLIEGPTTAFVVSIALLIIVIRDALDLRMTVDRNTIAIARISRNKYRQRLISHKPLELLAGVVIGIVLPLVLNAIM